MTDPTDRLRRYGEDIASAVNPARSRVAAMRAIGRASSARSPRRAPRLALATLAVLVVGNVVTASVADAAVPGDLLYPLDRGYEEVADLVGLGGDHTPERVEEAQVLVERGDHTDAVDLLAESVDTDVVRGAAAALQEMAPSDPQLPEHVEALVSGTQDLVEARRQGETRRLQEATAAVRLLAIQIGDQVRDSRPDGTGPPSDTPGEGEPPSDIPGQGPPDSVPGQGPPDSVPGQGDPGGSDQGNDSGQGPPAEDPPGATSPGQGRSRP
ncbi:MAG: hypothetical protein ACLFWM_05870 [Actinomycetota bacterium]